jgi:hypothetical protein
MQIARRKLEDGILNLCWSSYQAMMATLLLGFGSQNAGCYSCDHFSLSKQMVQFGSTIRERLLSKVLAMLAWGTPHVKGPTVL